MIAWPYKRNSVIGPTRTKLYCWPHWRFRRIPLIALVSILAAYLAGEGAARASSGNSDVETRIKAAFVYNFARFVEWPARSVPGPVRIGIVGHGDLGGSIEDVIRGKLANGRPIEMAYLNAVADADCCEILLIERSESKRVREIAQALAGKPILTVSDSESGFRDGVMIAFQIVNESVRFQINQDAAERAGLKISSQLLKVALPGPGKRP
jgi:hypothetical protein